MASCNRVNWKQFAGVYLTEFETAQILIHCVTKTTDIAHYNFTAYQLILAEMLLREYAIEWRFVIPPLLTNVSALPGKMLTCKHCI